MARTKKAEKPVLYQITLNECQLRLIMQAAEEWSRLRMGQTWDLSDALAFQHFEYGNGNHEEFNLRIERRDAVRDVLDVAMKLAAGRDDKHWYKTPETETMLDIWRVIRNFWWHQTPEDERSTYSTDADPLYLWGPEPGIKVEKVE